MSEDPNTLSVNVSETIQAGDVMGGSEKKKEDPVARQIEKDMEYLKRYVTPHNKPSRIVEEKDIPYMLKEAEMMVRMCRIPRGQLGGAVALAHMQVEDKDPLRFFVLKDGFLVVNPVIINNTNQYVDRKEGCMSFPGELQKETQRFNRVTVLFQAVVKDKDSPDWLKLSETREENLNGHLAHIFQHELSHINGVNCYDETYTPESCLGVVLPEDVDKDIKNQ